jgi:hypothetical protein
MNALTETVFGKSRAKLLVFAAIALTTQVFGGQPIRESSLEQETSERKRPIEAMQDNSFFVEEAYNQEPGVVQHIFTAFGSVNKLRGNDERILDLSFSQEWPIFSQTHQFSYTIPYLFVDAGGETENGVGDIELNYRLQLFTETESRPAVAPSLSVILPTGDAENGLGNETVGFAFNLPVSKVVSDRWAIHGNAGFTIFPDVQNRDLTAYNLGASVIYAVSPTFNVLLEAVAEWEEEIGELGEKDGSFSAILSPGFRYAVNFPNDSQLVVGLAAPIGLTGDAPDYGVFVYFSFEHSFLRR